MMKVYYCKHCARYKFSNRRRTNCCPICGGEFVEIPVDFLEFSDMNEEERKAIIQKKCK